MTLTIGIVGLPNVGKSTTFNALTRTQNTRRSPTTPSAPSNPTGRLCRCRTPAWNDCTR